MESVLGSPLHTSIYFSLLYFLEVTPPAVCELKVRPIDISSTLSHCPGIPGTLCYFDIAI